MAELTPDLYSIPYASWLFRNQSLESPDWDTWFYMQRLTPPVPWTIPRISHRFQWTWNASIKFHKLDTFYRWTHPMSMDDPTDERWTECFPSSFPQMDDPTWRFALFAASASLLCQAEALCFGGAACDMPSIRTSASIKYLWGCLCSRASCSWGWSASRQPAWGLWNEELCNAAIFLCL